MDLDPTASGLFTDQLPSNARTRYTQVMSLTINQAAMQQARWSTWLPTPVAAGQGVARNLFFDNLFWGLAAELYLSPAVQGVKSTLIT